MRRTLIAGGLICGLIAGLLLMPQKSARAADLNFEDYPIIKLRALDKITARAMNIEAKVGSTVKFGDVFIKVQACRKPPPIEKDEAAGFLQIYQTDGTQPEATTTPENKTQSSWIFSGWMYASSPALSAMDHPVYDVWVVDCAGRDPEPLPPPEQQVEDQKGTEPSSTTKSNDGTNAPATTTETTPDGNKPAQPQDSKTPAESAIDDSTAHAPSTDNQTTDVKKNNDKNGDTTTPSTTAPSTPAAESNPPTKEPSLDEMLNPKKAVTNANEQTAPKDPYIYSPAKHYSDSNSTTNLNTDTTGTDGGADSNQPDPLTAPSPTPSTPENPPTSNPDDYAPEQTGKPVQGIY